MYTFTIKQTQNHNSYSVRIREHDQLESAVIVATQAHLGGKFLPSDTEDPDRLAPFCNMLNPYFIAKRVSHL